MASGPTYTPLAWTSLGAASATITLSSIPTGYTDLRLVFTAPSASNLAQVYLRFNGDTATNYSYRMVYGNGGVGTGAAQSSNAILTDYALAVQTSNMPVGLIADIMSYTYAKYKTVLTTYFMSLNASSGTTGDVEHGVGVWRSTATINSITVTSTTAAAFNAGTTVALYGIAAA